ncbi:MAG: hypothetical protein K2X98_02490 [Alphaproteobacteria bacterium]|nr:hypothetical protein [Alphaproteobacteria bacterium]
MVVIFPADYPITIFPNDEILGENLLILTQLYFIPSTILGFTASPRIFWISSFVGMSSVIIARIYAGGVVGTGHFDAAIIGITTNLLTFTLLRKFAGAHVKTLAREARSD